MTASLTHNRFDWIDRMKAIGIYLVVLGHFYSFGEQFIYVFHVPLFFLISGLLTKKEDNIRLFWQKLWYNLAVPMLIMATLNVVFDCVGDFFYGTFSPMTLYWFVRNLLFGMVAGIDTLWFVYTLIIMKVLFQYCDSKKLFYALAIVVLAGAYLYNYYDRSGLPFFLKEPNAVVDVSVALPFFAMGIFLHDYMRQMNNWKHRSSLALMVVIGYLLVYICFLFNGNVELYRSSFGGDMFLFLLGGLSGSVMVFAVSKLIGQVPGMVFVISRGTIIILGFHKLWIAMVREFFPPSPLDILFAFLIVMVFVPIIVLMEKYFPLMAGKYRVKVS